MHRWFGHHTQVYGEYTRGFRSGSYNLRNTSPTASPGPFDEEGAGRCRGSKLMAVAALGKRLHRERVRRHRTRRLRPGARRSRRRQIHGRERAPEAPAAGTPTTFGAERECRRRLGGLRQFTVRAAPGWPMNSRDQLLTATRHDRSPDGCFVSIWLCRVPVLMAAFSSSPPAADGSAGTVLRTGHNHARAHDRTRRA